MKAKYFRLRKCVRKDQSRAIDSQVYVFIKYSILGMGETIYLLLFFSIHNLNPNVEKLMFSNEDIRLVGNKLILMKDGNIYAALNMKHRDCLLIRLALHLVIAYTQCFITNY